ncbi:U-scoloptoxin(16)-Er12a-like isoform X1 [Tachypleus tridentatus]|uniref:U-scoloptoxin(16)-Er12a-like isoform X1 n=1 Tax=Tachypleus tridentatus TaxID=6853 RepID=UPI003FD45523
MLKGLQTGSFQALFVVLFVVIPAFSYMYLKPIRIGLGRCIDENSVPHMVGDTWYNDKKCEKLSCVYLEGFLYISGYGCGSFGYSSECLIVKEKGNYPKCCPSAKC